MERGQELLEGRGNGRRGLVGLAFGLCLLVALVVVLPAAPSIAKKHKAVSLHFKGAPERHGPARLGHGSGRCSVVEGPEGAALGHLVPGGTGSDRPEAREASSRHQEGRARPEHDRQGGPAGLRGEPPDRHRHRRRQAQEGEEERSKGARPLKRLDRAVGAPVRRPQERCPVRDDRQPRHQLPVPVAERPLHGRRRQRRPPDDASTRASPRRPPTFTAYTSTRPASTKATASVPARASSRGSRASTIRPPSRRRAPSRSPTWTRRSRRTSRSC